MVVGSMVERNAYFYSAEISFFTAGCLVTSMSSKSGRPEKCMSDDAIKTKKSETSRSTFFKYWSWRTLNPITVKATGGILTALVHSNEGVFSGSTRFGVFSFVAYHSS